MLKLLMVNQQHNIYHLLQHMVKQQHNMVQLLLVIHNKLDNNNY